MGGVMHNSLALLRKAGVAIVATGYVRKIQTLRYFYKYYKLAA